MYFRFLNKNARTILITSEHDVLETFIFDEMRTTLGRRI